MRGFFLWFQAYEGVRTTLEFLPLNLLKETYDLCWFHYCSFYSQLQIIQIVPFSVRGNLRVLSCAIFNIRTFSRKQIF